MAQRDSRLIGGIYRVGQVIASGPVLSEYTAYNRNTSDVVGLLVFEVPPMIDAEAAQQLLQPLERRRRVESPHVIHVYDWGIDGSRAYIATDPPRGITLRQLLDNETLSLQRAVDIALQIARGLLALQAEELVDTDMRPQLVTVDTVGETDRAQLDDVGLRLLLKQLGYTNSQRLDDIWYLDPRYVAPECIQNGPVGPWSDVYQTGLILFELITGRVPFVGHTPTETAALQSNSPAPRMAQFRDDTPLSLQDVVDRALEKNPAMRYPNASALVTALEALSFPQRSRMAGWSGGGINGDTGPSDKIPVAHAHSSGLTDEMVSMPVEENISLRSTLIEDTATLTLSSSANEPAEPQNEGIYAFLCLEKDGESLQRFAIKDKYVIVGRVDPKRGVKPEIDLTAIDPRMTVSRQHARIRYEKTFFYIEDLKSRNKTRLGELPLVPLKPELLQHGDVVHFGSVRLIFKVPGMPEPSIKSANPQSQS
jgi:serine/threonine protein kinase